MAVPSIEVSIAFATDPAATPTWTDVTSYVQSVTWRRGRAHELDQYATGQLGLLLDNRDRRFEPEYAGSPYAPNVVPMRRVRVQAVHSAVTYPLFAGSINNWAVDYPGDADHWLDSDVSVSGMDGLGVLALARLTADFAQHSSLTRIGAVLDAVGWPAADRSLGAAQQSVAAVSLTEASALSHLQAVVEAENGAIFADRAGVITTFNRHNRLRPSPTYVATYSDAGTLHYKKYKRGTAADRIVNDDDRILDVISIFFELRDEIDKCNRSLLTFAQIPIVLTNPVSDDLIAFLLLIEVQAKLRAANEAMQDVIELLCPDRFIRERRFYGSDL